MVDFFENRFFFGIQISTGFVIANVEHRKMVPKSTSNADHERGEKSGDSNQSESDGGKSIRGGVIFLLFLKKNLNKIWFLIFEFLFFFSFLFSLYFMKNSCSNQYEYNNSMISKAAIFFNKKKIN